jgi:hypothetical protein
MTPNYPNHPLFRIAPLLDRGFQTVNFDPYERVLIAKIRAGRHSPDLWDCNSFYLGYSQRFAADGDRQHSAMPSRYKLTPEQLHEYREKCREKWLAQAPQRAERRAQREEEARFWREWLEEQKRNAREYAERTAARAAEQERRDREWLEAEARANDDRAILSARWECSSCKTRSEIKRVPEGFQLGCRTCGRACVAKPEAFLALMGRPHFNP